MVPVPGGAGQSKVGSFAVERGTAEAESSKLETSAGLLPLFAVWEQACSFAERVLDFLVKVCECCGVKVGWNHPNLVHDFADPGAVSKQAGGHQGFFDAGDLGPLSGTLAPSWAILAPY